MSAPRRGLLRNIDGQDHLEVFVVSAITAILSIRLVLHLTGYPQIGGPELHIAHLMWGGLFMLAQLTSVPLPDGVAFPIGSFLLGMLPYALIGAAAACFGAYTRLR